MTLPWFIVSTLLLLLLVSAVYRRFALSKVSYSRYFSAERVYEGEQVEMIEEIVNGKPLPLPWLRLESSIASGLVFGSQENLGISSGEIYQNHISLFYLRPYRRIKRRHRITCERRGLFRLESVTVTAGDMFGIGGNVTKFPLELELTVYPEPLDKEELPLPVHSWLGELAVKRWIIEDPFLTSGTREYIPGDALSLVNWKATARTGAMQVHRKDYTADSRLIICLNVEDSESMWRSATDAGRIELGIRYAATVAEAAMDSGIETGLLCNGCLEGDREQEPVSAERAGALEEMLALLARLQLDRSLPMHRLLVLEAEKASDPADYLIISCHRGPELLAAAEQLRLLGNGVEWLDIPQDGGAAV
ncbi:DUF58 domain-containing protein [Paenibacillus tengchongensis]|uniref:DUF58 domain-containing protein n=1 Tax=Paenibacillus tengchongensis TaxID=2608684 RepID=UPI00124D5E32|nr:DUF58 domain-containing protein [Paenibacillus tengchongensis]